MRNHILLLIMLRFAFFAHAEDTLRMKSFEVHGSHVTSGQRELCDSLQMLSFQLQSISMVLQQMNSINLRSYGPSMLSSVSVRGGNASQTNLSWKGMNISNAMLGQSDLSLIPVAFFNGTTLQFGTVQNKNTQGISGGIELSTSNDTSKQSIEISSMLSSLNNQSTFIGYGRNSSKNKLNFKILESTGKNQFDFFYDYKKAARFNTGAHQSKMLTMLLDESYKVNHQLTFKFSGWLTSAFRELPQTKLESKSSSEQADKDVKCIAGLHYMKRNSSLDLSYLINRNQIDYDDANIISNSTFTNHQVKLTHQQKTKHLFIESNYTMYASSAINSSYIQSSNQLLLQTLSSRITKDFTKQLKIIIEGSVYARNKHQLYPTYSIQLDKQHHLSKQTILKIYSAYYTGVRFPTLNDLYWNPGGNVSLKAENGNNGNLGISIEHPKMRISIESYLKHTKNMIVWVPVGNYWKPLNILEVTGNGVEFSGTFKHSIHQFKLQAKLDASLNASTIKQQQGNEQLKGKQLPYVPFYKANSNLSMSYKKSYINLQTQYVGHRFTSQDNKEFLNPYLLLNLQVGQGFLLCHHQVQVNLNLYNLLNEYYETIAYRPMPSRYTELSINLKL